MLGMCACGEFFNLFYTGNLSSFSINIGGSKKQDLLYTAQHILHHLYLKFVMTSLFHGHARAYYIL